MTKETSLINYPLPDGVVLMKGVHAVARFILLVLCFLIWFGQGLNSETVYIQSNRWMILLLLCFIIFLSWINNFFTAVTIFPNGIRIWFDFWPIAIRWEEMTSVYLVKTIPFNEFFFITTNRKMPLAYILYALFFLHKNQPGFVISSKLQGVSEIIGEIYQHTGLTILEVNN